jgi:hypothetical protein
MTLTYKTTHEVDGLALLIAQFIDLPNIRAYITPFLTQIQEIEDALYQVFQILPDFENQVGAQLDLVGSVVGQDRGGLADALYIKWILARILINRGSGTPDEFLRVLDLLVSNEKIYTETYPAAFYIELLDALTEVDADDLASILSELRAAGVGAGLQYSLVDNDYNFTFAPADVEVVDSKRGWSAGSVPLVEEIDLDPPHMVVIGQGDGTDAELLTNGNDFGTLWVSQANPASWNLYGIAWSPTLGLYAAGGVNDGTDAYLIVASEADGTWVEKSNPQNVQIRDMAWIADLGLFVAVGLAAVGGGYILTSPDGDTWTFRANPKSEDLFAITWGQSLGLAVAVGDADGADSYIVTSPDLINWTERAPTVPKNVRLWDIVWAEELSLFCAVGNSDGADSYILTSPDGLVWTEQVSPQNIFLASVAWSPTLSLFCAIGGLTGGGDVFLITSPDGVTWTFRANGAGNTNYNGATWSEALQLFIVVGNGGALMTSPDGIAWTIQTTPNTEHLYALIQPQYIIGGRWADIEAF